MKVKERNKGVTLMRISPRYLVAALFMALALMASEAVAGGGNKEGTAAADQLLIPVGAKGIALGSAYTAGITGIEAIYYNPAGLSGSNHGVEVMFSQMNGLDSDGISFFGVGSNFAGFITLGITYSRALTDRIRAGVTANLISEELDRVSTSGFAFDVGVQYAGLAGVDGLELGVTLRHLGGNMSYDGSGLLRLVDEIGADRNGQLLKIESAGFQLPTSLEIGMAYRKSFDELHDVAVMTSFENNNFLSDQYRIGVEYTFDKMLSLRGSMPITGNDKTDFTGAAGYIYGPAFGVGLQQWAGDAKIYLDYAYRTREVFDGQHVFTFKIGF
jgi:hypothetical protein